LAGTFKEPIPLPYMGNGISPCHSTERAQLSSQPNIILLTAVAYLCSTLTEEYNLTDTPPFHIAWQ